MAKPSIFSRDYKRQMRRRRRNRAIIISSVILLIIVGFGAINFSYVKAKIQNYVYKTEEDIEEVQTDKEVIQQQTDEIEEFKEEKKVLDLSIGDGRNIKVEYDENNNIIKFKDVLEIPKGIYYNISPSKEFLLIIDEKQNMKIIDSKSKVENITSPTYIAPNGERFEKDSTLQIYSNYIWNSEAKFISDSKVAYISNIPYFGSNLNKYIWIVDIQNKAHTTIWNSKAKDIKLLSQNDKGLEISIEGNIKYLDKQGKLLN
ncbi:hypothetical protein K4H70_03955 [Clostridium chauvoei]|uniref:hypothetical protein n=1 Tax=Clostridium chauvoei TaxID=46867 RepID=UPI001C85A49A|nr:hypothetical protein [Clostridium chauvoei]MBX7365770.1 hypothetical protein [Clostridium chauvoei]